MSDDFRRHGLVAGYWGTLDASNNPIAAAVLSNGYSKALYMNEATNSFALVISVSAATTISLLAAHSSQLTAEGDEPDHSTAPGNSYFGQVYWNSTAIQIQFTSSGVAYIQVPDFVAGWTMLQSSGAANIWAGFEAT